MAIPFLGRRRSGIFIAALLLVPLHIMGSSGACGGVIDGVAGGRYDQGVLKPFEEIIAKDFSFDIEIGFLEFDLATLSPAPNPSIVLNLHDSGGLLSGLSNTRVYIYSGDGVITTGDLTIAAIDSFDISRSFLSGGSQHDVKAAVNSILVAGGSHVGFRFEPIGGSTWDAFGTASANELVFSDVPEPTVCSVIVMVCGVCLGRAGRRRNAAWLS